MLDTVCDISGSQRSEVAVMFLAHWLIAVLLWTTLSAFRFNMTLQPGRAEGIFWGS